MGELTNEQRQAMVRELASRGVEATPDDIQAVTIQGMAFDGATGPEDIRKALIERMQAQFPQMKVMLPEGIENQLWEQVKDCME